MWIKEIMVDNRGVVLWLLLSPLSLPHSSSSLQFFYSTSAQAGLQESRRIAGGREGERGEELQEDYSSARLMALFPLHLWCISSCNFGIRKLCSTTTQLRCLTGGPKKARLPIHPFICTVEF